MLVVLGLGEFVDADVVLDERAQSRDDGGVGFVRVETRGERGGELFGAAVVMLEKSAADVLLVPAVVAEMREVR